MLRKLTVMMAVLTIVASASNAWVEGEGWFELRDYGVITEGPEAGNYEYIYDVYNGVDGYNFYANLLFDATGVVNQYTYYDVNGDDIPDPNCLTQSWSSEAAGTPRPYGGYIDPERWPSYWKTDPVTFKQDWLLPTSGPNVEWAMYNYWHTGGDYNIGSGVYTWRKGWVDETGVHWENQRTVTDPTWFTPGLMFTFRLVHPMPKGTDNLTWHMHHNRDSQSYYGTVDGPLPMPEYPDGDFDENTHVDTLDIDLLCDFIRNGMPYDALYDISADGLTGGTDGVVNMLDLDYLIRFLVETSLGTGTEYGDFNLDGLVDTTDLTRLATYYGAGDTWAKGNANRYVDLVTDTTDLTILATYYGFGGPDAVPEPASAGLLLLGASAVLTRRRKAKR